MYEVLYLKFSPHTFSVTVKFGACCMKVQWGEFRINKTILLYILRYFIDIFCRGACFEYASFFMRKKCQLDCMVSTLSQNFLHYRRIVKKSRKFSSITTEMFGIVVGVLLLLLFSINSYISQTFDEIWGRISTKLFAQNQEIYFVEEFSLLVCCKYSLNINIKNKYSNYRVLSRFIWVFFHDYSRIAGLQ